jgi:hypothetical protein
MVLSRVAEAIKNTGKNAGAENEDQSGKERFSEVNESGLTEE